MYNKPPARIRIAMLDDHPIVRFGIAARLEEEPDFELAGSYASSREMVEGLRNQPAEILLVDYSLGPSEIDGVSLIRALRIKYPQSHVIVVSSHYTPATVSMALRVGARGFVGKCEDLDNVVRAVRVVASGGIHLDDDMKYYLSEIPTQDMPEMEEEEMSEDLILDNSALSAREREVIRCFLDGMTVSEIAEKFGRSIKTISTQKSTAYKKLGVTSDNGLFKLKHMLDKPQSPRIQ